MQKTILTVFNKTAFKRMSFGVIAVQNGRQIPEKKIAPLGF